MFDLQKLLKKKQKNKPASKAKSAEKNSKAKSAKKVNKKKVKKKRSLIARVFFLCLYFCLAMGIIVFLGLWLYAKTLNDRYKLDDGALGGTLWELPSRVYARPLDLYIGKPLKIKDLTTELRYLDYSLNKAIPEAGTYYVDGKYILIYKKGFGFWDAKEPAQKLRLTIEEGKITDMLDLTSLEPVVLTRIEPLLIGSIYPKHGQDRILIDLDSTPEVLVDTILATEDRRFYSHHGVDPKGLMRALTQALKDGKVKQGASTLTQQFVKNHYLSNERRLSRKVKEALMALTLEHNYSKQQILEGYLNEIFLGQDGSRAIHGFGLASEFYFGKPLNHLGVHQIATLVALVKEPSRANPFRHPEFAKARRGLILDVMASQRLITTQEAQLAKSLPLDVLPKVARKKQDRYYSFLQLVMHRIKEEYDSDRLASGLNVFTTLDPILQDRAEKSVAASLPVLEKRNGLRNNFLQAASVLVNTATAEVVAIVGDRDPKRHGFNRAFQAKRQPGSLLKPVVYMSALEYPQRYNLTTRIDDSPLVYKVKGETWSPKNYSKRNRGSVMLIDGLVHSYNIPTARLALDIGIDDFIGRLQDLGARKKLPHYPSIVLGSVAMSPLEIAQIYETLANGGYRMPLRVIRSVTDARDKPVNRYPMESVKVISDEPYYLIVKAMQDVVKRGTANKLKQKIAPELNIAGKTGTTDDYRDSWFAGFSGNYLNVVWVGNDNNRKTKLSGSKGAMRVWMDIMKEMPLKPLSPKRPANVVERSIDMSNGLLMAGACRKIHRAETLPFISGTQPRRYGSCYSAPKPASRPQAQPQAKPQSAPTITLESAGSVSSGGGSKPPMSEKTRKELESFIFGK